MANTVRFLWQNFTHGGNAVMQASSSMSGRSVEWLRHQLRTKTWRSGQGWSFVKGFNDVLRFDEGSDERIAYVDGEYSSAAAAATALQTAVGAAGLEPDSLGASLWLKGDALQLNDGADVASWPDSSGNGRTLDTSVGTQTYHRSILNGRPAVRFEDDGYLYAAASAVQMDDILDGSGRGSIFVVAWVDTDHTTSDFLWAQADDNRGLMVDGSDDAVARAYDGTQDNATLAGSFAGGWHLFVWQYDGTNVSAFADDIDDAGAATTASGAQTTLTQDFYLGSDGAFHLKGYIAEIVAIPGDVTEENHRRLAAYVAQKYPGVDLSATTAPTWTNTYTVAYGAITKKFTLARATGAATFELPWTDAAYVGRTLGVDIGFSVAADDTGATSYEADSVAYQSRHFIEVDLGGILGVKSAVVINHNSGTTGTYTVEANDETWWEDTPDASQSLVASTRPSEIRNVFFAEVQKRYWRLVIEDVQNPAGYNELGIFYLGTYFEPGRSFRPGWQKAREELSKVGFSDHGAPFFDDKPTLEGWRLSFRPLLELDKTKFETMAAYVKTSRMFFFAFDADTTPDLTYYVFTPKGLLVRHMQNSTSLYRIDLDLERAPL